MNQSQPQLELVLRPHRSLSPAGFTAIMVALAGLSFVAGIVFLVVGAWPVVGFLGLDVALVYWAFRSSYAAGREVEHVSLTAERLTVRRRGRDGRERVFDFQPYWLRVELEQEPSGSGRLVLRSHGRSFVLGAFLAPEERAEVARVLREALSAMRTPDVAPAAADAAYRPSTSFIE